MSEDDSTISGALDMANGNDRATLGSAIKKRWAITDDRKADLMRALDIAKSKAEADEDTRAIVNIGRLYKDMEAQNQTDEMIVDKNSRIDDGKGTESVEHYIVEMPKARELTD